MLFKIRHTFLFTFHFSKPKDSLCEIGHLCLFQFIGSCCWTATEVAHRMLEKPRKTSPWLHPWNHSQAGTSMSWQAGRGICYCIDCQGLFKSSGLLKGCLLSPPLSTCIPVRLHSSSRHRSPQIKVALFFNARILLANFPAIAILTADLTTQRSV